MTPERDAVLRELVARIAARRPGRPLRVAIDGPDAAGKTTLADELADRLLAMGVPVIRASADDFATPRAVRHRRGRESPEGYRHDSLDVAALVDGLLDPLGPGGDRRYRTRAFDIDADAAVEATWSTAPEDAVLLVDGVFLGRAALLERWDVRMFVAVSPATTLARARVRDVPRLGTADEVEAYYRARYLPAQAAYLAEERAEATADLVVDNEDPARPVLRIHDREPGNGPAAVPGYRRETMPDPEAVGEDEALVAAIRDEIAREGPITFARFMERALYEPGHGYYRRPEAGPGLAGADFLTAPEAHPIAGAAVGRLLEQAWEAMGRPGTFRVVEPGAGTGALAAGLLGALRDLGSPLLASLRYLPLEVEATRQDALRARLAEAGLDSWLADQDEGDARPGPGLVIANEVLDALPVHRVVGRAGGLRELLVALGTDGPFAWHEAVATTPALEERLRREAVTLADGQVTEICLLLDGWFADVASRIDAGVVVVVDYAAEPADLHGAKRPDGTLRAFARHAVGGDPFRHVGRQDLTATVDLAAVRHAAAAAGLAPLGETTQAELLTRAVTPEVTDAYLRGPGATLEGALALRSALARLLDPRGIGGFRVLAFGHGLPPGTRLGAMERVPRPGS